jgi:hypothetical protein
VPGGPPGGPGATPAASPAARDRDSAGESDSGLDCNLKTGETKPEPDGGLIEYLQTTYDNVSRAEVLKGKGVL